MKKHDELRKVLDELNDMERSYASHIVTEVLKYLMDSIQPERSKREDFCDLGHELTGVPTTEESWCIKCGEESHVIEKQKMRCSEHDGNIVREVQ